MTKLPRGAYQKDGKTYDARNTLIECVDGKWLQVKDPSRSGWWRHHEHYDRNGYCDNPGRGY
jgi:hypothetical protein